MPSSPPLPNLAPKFTVIGERICTHREDFNKRVAERDRDAVIREVRRQQRAGVSHLDICAEGSGLREMDDMLWLLDTVLPVVKDHVGLSIDSSSHATTAKALFRIQGRPNTIINGVTHDPAKLEGWTALAAQHQTALVAIGKSMTAPMEGPPTAQERVSIAEQLHRAISAAGIPDERIYFDPHLLPVSYEAHQPRAVLEAIPEIRRRFPNAHILAGLSNVSFNLPRRKLLNRTYLPMLLAAGADTLLLDPCDGELRNTLIAARTLLGDDDFMVDYLAAMSE